MLGGDPGIGKSTMLLQICGKLSEKMKILYIAGEESKSQLKLRAKRIGVDSKNLLIAPMWSADKKRVLNTINKYLKDNNITQGNKTS